MNMIDKSIKMTLNKNNNIFSFNFDECVNIEPHVIEGLTNKFTKIIYQLIDWELYDLNSLVFTIDNKTDIQKKRVINRPKNALGVYYNPKLGDTNFSWDGIKEMDWHSKYLLNMFFREYSVLEFLTDNGYNLTTIFMRVRTKQKHN